MEGVAALSIIKKLYGGIVHQIGWEHAFIIILYGLVWDMINFINCTCIASKIHGMRHGFNVHVRRHLVAFSCDWIM